MKKVRVAVIGGYGTIGKRVADAVRVQPDMELIGIAGPGFDWRAAMMAKKGIPIYLSQNARIDEFKKHNYEPAGTIDDLLQKVDIVVDASPEGWGEKNKPLYDKYNVKAIFQGGEDHELTNASFVAARNFLENFGRQYTRVVSCNTTAICRVIGAIHERIGVKRARVSIFRRAADPWESHKKGIINTVVPDLEIPSHHGPDARTVIKDLDILTIAAKGSHNLYHLHAAFVELKDRVTKEQVIKALEDEPRVVFVSGKDKVEALNTIFEIGRELGRSRGDVYEIPVWLESIALIQNDLTLMWATPEESNVIPENIDAIRALTGIEEEPRKSIETTDRTLNIVKKFY
ncbi:MAG TPA: type II glyceraldehyde-3-phosphate dehydrogenase [Geobacterales bacterium]|nr:type II glyceraldehyde-3-phosphate dehydrogenase [Geobacterales bacterium]